LQVLGRSNIVGIPVALLLMQRNATVTIAHSRTKDIEAVVKRADIVVAAVGRAEFVKASWLKVLYIEAMTASVSAALFPR
jgi:methylenetetrahydrofolate dehydrogenase (NADP+)/methenyltetrahydrofolate cyclohydrolase